MEMPRPPAAKPATKRIATKIPSPPQPVTIEIRVRLQVLAIPEPGGGYSVVVPALPGCVSEAGDLETVRQVAREAANGWLEVAHDRAKDEALRVARGE